jgi:hypothetical protein
VLWCRRQSSALRLRRSDSSIQITFDIHGHLVPGGEGQAPNCSINTSCERWFPKDRQLAANGLREPGATISVRGRLRIT